MSKIKIDTLPTPLIYVVAMIKNKKEYYPADCYGFISVTEYLIGVKDKKYDYFMLEAFTEATNLSSGIFEYNLLLGLDTTKLLKTKEELYSFFEKIRSKINVLSLKDLKEEIYRFEQLVEKPSTDVVLMISEVLESKTESFEDFEYLKSFCLKYGFFEKASELKKKLKELSKESNENLVKYFAEGYQEELGILLEKVE